MWISANTLDWYAFAKSPESVSFDVVKLQARTCLASQGSPLLGLAAAFCVATSSALLTVSNAEAQSAGMERRRNDGEDEQSDVRSVAQGELSEEKNGANEGV